jgi:transcriptional regulator with GAF, ATPase, and Fis domain
MSETWDQMTRRHERERREMVERLAAERLTQTHAARRLGISLSGLNNFIQRKGIFWPVIRQGYRS